MGDCYAGCTFLATCQPPSFLENGVSLWTIQSEANVVLLLSQGKKKKGVLRITEATRFFEMFKDTKEFCLLS